MKQAAHTAYTLTILVGCRRWEIRMSSPSRRLSEPNTGAASRIQRASGTPRAIGCQLGRMIGKRLEMTIATYVAEGPARFGTVNWTRLDQETGRFLETLPSRFVDEMEGLSEGSGVPLCRIAEWTFVESCISFGCSSILVESQGKTWIARNNDLWAPGLWGFATIRDIDHDGRLPTLLFGMEGETFSATGVNRERLWLHAHFLPTEDRPVRGKPAQLFSVWITDALETCERLRDVVDRLAAVQRTAAMLLFAVDGKTGARAVFECGCVNHRALRDPKPWIAGTNHRRTAVAADLGSRSRLDTLIGKAAALCRNQDQDQDQDQDQRGDWIAQQLIELLADPAVEQGKGCVRDCLLDRRLPPIRRAALHIRRIPGGKPGTLGKAPLALGGLSQVASRIGNSPWRGRSSGVGWRGRQPGSSAIRFIRTRGKGRWTPCGEEELDGRDSAISPLIRHGGNR
ncbi:hypothetical protein JW848_01050 [Candidatus Bipolaricaulota bacterium]|nr:hypothetical protein [Candidatus Bipolaricaulota bacterium]